MMRHPQHRQQQEQRGGLRIEQVQVDSPSGETLVHPLSLHLNPGEILGLIGESGSGKTTLATALLGHVRRGARIVSGRLTLDGSSHELASRGAHRAGAVAGLAYVPQSPGAHLNPSARLHEIFRDLVAGRWDAAAEERLQRSLGGAGLPGDAAFLRRYPHQLSGGQQQRVALAAALFKQARVLILDEPTSGLDLLTASHVVQTLLRLNREFGVALLCVSHDMRFIEQIAHRVAVMREGRIVEQGVVAEVLAAPAHAYTRQLLAAIPGGAIRPPAAPAAATPAPPLLEVRALAARHGGAGLAVDDVSFAVGRGRWVALIGASGSGKTSIATVLAGLQARCGGQVLLDGAPLPALAEQRDASQRRRIQIVLQDPQGSLNPRQTVRTAIARPLRFLRGLSGAELEREVLRLVQAVSLPAGILDNHAADLSGGECQRVAIARALAAQPDLLICDEITSALDVSVQAAILALLQELRVRLGLSILFITHQLDVVADVADELIVLETGRVIEAGPAASVLAAPRTEWMRRTVDALRQPPVPLPARRASA